MFRAERLRIFPFRGTKFFSVVFQKNLVVGSRRTGVFSAEQNFFPNGIFLFLVFSARNKILFRRKKYFSVQKIQADFFFARKKEKKANWNIFRGLRSLVFPFCIARRSALWIQTNRPFVLRARVGIPKRRQLFRKSIHRSLVLRTIGIGAVAASEKVGTTHHSS